MPIENHLNISFDESLFQQAYSAKLSTWALEYLIMEKKIPYTETIENLIAGNSIVENMFLNRNLNSELPEKDISDNRFKL